MAPALPLTVGIGLDAGEAVAVQGGYWGGALNLAARLCGQARAGEILGSREVTHLARASTVFGTSSAAAYPSKGLAEPVSVVRVVPEGPDAVERLRPFAPPPRRRGRPRALGRGHRDRNRPRARRDRDPRAGPGGSFHL